MNGVKRDIEVFADWSGLGGVRRMGLLSALRLRGREVFSFEYDTEWLRKDERHLLDPELRFFQGPQYPQKEMQNFGMFLDSSPDRWGRMLMRRREAAQARKEKRAMRELMESDFLLGVHDATRLGALRFREVHHEGFQGEDTRMAAPPWTSLRDLEYASHMIEQNEDDENIDTWLAILLVPGSSLGGARPKASVLLPDGSLWLAKFPAKDDGADTGAWEMVIASLAQSAGIEMSECRTEVVSSRGSTFLTRRFDRDSQGRRIHFASAMTMLGYSDGADSKNGASYLEIADFIVRHGAQPKKDLMQLWKRIVFNIAISNADDHLRNHGFLLDLRGWKLSPAFDINPIPYARGLSLAIDESDNSLDFELAMSVAEYFRISDIEANKIMEEILGAVRQWQKVASLNGISRSEQEKMAGAFRCTTNF